MVEIHLRAQDGLQTNKNTRGLLLRMVHMEIIYQLALVEDISTSLKEQWLSGYPKKMRQWKSLIGAALYIYI